MKRRYLISVYAVLFFATATVRAAVYHEGFEIGSGGWVNSGQNATWHVESTGGVGDSGYLEGARPTYSPAFEPDSGEAAAFAAGNLEAVYGQWIHISFYGKIITLGGTGRDVLHLFGYDSGIGPVNATSRYTHWVRTVSAAADLHEFNQWKEISFIINTNWSNQQARAEGWTMLTGSGRGEADWSTVMHDIYTHSPFYGFNIGNTTVSGIDEFRMETVPVPSSALLLGLGLTGLSFIHLRKKPAGR